MGTGAKEVSFQLRAAWLVRTLPAVLLAVATATVPVKVTEKVRVDACGARSPRYHPIFCPEGVTAPSVSLVAGGHWPTGVQVTTSLPGLNVIPGGRVSMMLAA